MLRQITLKTRKAKRPYNCSICQDTINIKTTYHRLVLCDDGQIEEHVICPDCEEQLMWLTISDFESFAELSEYIYQGILCRRKNDMIEAAADAEHERRMFDMHEAIAINKENKL